MRRRERQGGFVLPVVVILLALGALLAGDALLAAAQAQVQATSGRLQQQAFEAAEGALARAEVQLRDLATLPPPTSEFPVTAEIGAEVGVQLVLSTSLVTGYSANRVMAQAFRVRSEAHAPRATRLQLEAGFTRLVPAP